MTFCTPLGAGLAQGGLKIKITDEQIETVIEL